MGHIEVDLGQAVVFSFVGNGHNDYREFPFAFYIQVSIIRGGLRSGVLL